MAGRLLDYLAQGLAAARPVAATLAPKISAGGLAFYYATDTNALSLLDVAAVAWDSLSGGGGGIADGDYGDISVSAGATLFTIDPNVVTLGKMAQLATGTILGRVGAGLGNVEALTMAQVKTGLALTKSDVGLGNVDNTSDANKPVSTAQATALALKADLASPALTGTPSAPTAAAVTNSTQLATTAFVQTLVANLIASAPGVLDTLDEIAAALGDDPNFAATMTTALANKQPIDETLTALAGLAGGADKLAYFTGVDVLAQADFTAFGRTLIGLASAAALRATINVADGATANSPDATLLARANHTGSQSAATISDFTEAAQDVIGAMIVGAGGSYDDPAGTITLPGAADSRAPSLGTDFTHRNLVQDDFTIAIIGTGAAFTTAPVAAALSANHPGVHQWRSGTTANSGVQCHTDVFAFRIGGGEQWDVNFFTGPVLTTINWRSGAMDSITSAASVDGIWLAMDLNGNIVGKTRSNSVESVTATIAALAVSTWYHGRISVNAAATLVTFTVYDDAGTVLGTQTLAANIPTAAGRETGWGSIMTSTGVVAIELGHIDRQKLSNPGRVVARGAA